MRCPQCGSDTVVYRTDTDTKGVERRRRCLKCELRFKTSEEYLREISGWFRADIPHPEGV